MMIRQYNIEELSHRVKYTVRGTYLFGNDKVIVEQYVYINDDWFGNEILKTFTDDEPDFVDGEHVFIKGEIQIDIDDDFGDIEEISIFNDDGKEIFHCYDIETLQQYLVAVEIVEAENLEEE